MDLNTVLFGIATGIGGAWLMNWIIKSYRKFTFQTGKWVLISPVYPAKNIAGRLAIIIDSWGEHCWQVQVYYPPTKRSEKNLGLMNLGDHDIETTQINESYLSIWKPDTEKGGKHMPRIFRYTWYLILLLVVWKAYVNLDVIVPYLTKLAFGIR